MDYSPETSQCTVAPSPTDTPSRGEGAAVHRLSEMDRLQNNPYFCVFKYARAVKQKVWNEAENRERDWGETLKMLEILLSPHTPYGRVRLARFARARLLRHALPISLLILRKKPTVLQSTNDNVSLQYLILQSITHRVWTSVLLIVT